MPARLTLLLARLLNGLESLDLLGLVQAGMIVEQIGHKGQVQLVDAIDHILWRQEAAAIQLGRLLQHDLGTLLQIRFTECIQIDIGLVAGNLLQQMRIDLRVDNVRLEVGAATRDASAFQMMIDPAQEDCLRGHLHQILETLVVEQQSSKAGTAVQSDVTEETDADDLPQQTEHQMRLALGQIVGIDVDNVAANGLRGDQGKRQVLELTIDGQVLLVNGALIDGVGAGVVDDLAQQDAVLDGLIETLALGIDGQQVLQILVVSQIRVNPIGEGQLLLQAHRMCGALRRYARHAAQGLEVLLLGDDRLECARYILGLEVQAQCLEFLQVQFTLVRCALFVLELVDHLAHLVASQLEAHLVEGILQLVQIDEAILVGVQLQIEKVCEKRSVRQLSNCVELIND